LIADRFNNPQKAYTIIEQVRGRAAADLLASRITTPSAAKTIERAVSRLRLKLMAAQSTHDVASLRDEIFMEEQARWVTPGASVLQANSRETVAVEQLQKRLPASTVLLEYVMAATDHASCAWAKGLGSKRSSHRI